ncbi:hypothetical protein ACFSKN_15030 [Mariniflexile gromovii]|uniref:Uncharacterized protein n=1 Tax=Mariniflexile gromovii TaxID=362523 RepID=A0ABS4C059_9FLAO|nr:hypothetical protein [Mariniflexile gromovii]MBP0905876.1 hypothetical protein [Mariniflexile gromovii]
MKKSEILYEPLPIGRIGVKKSTEEVIAAKDFSCFAEMIEEYIGFGAVNIVMPSSAPEIESLTQMPLLLRERIKIIDDSEEIETVSRVLFNIRKEFNAKLNEDSNFLKFPKNTDRAIIENLDQLHIDVKKLALGFNHSIQIGFDVNNSINSLREIRKKVSNPISRLTLAQLEGLLNQYKNIEFDALIIPKKDTPRELISIFDKLINDAKYLQYSDTITQLSIPEKRESALVDLRSFSRNISSKKYVQTSWDYVTKLLTVWSGVPVPDSKTIATIIKGKELPQLVNLENAKQRALEMWKNSNLTTIPLTRSGEPIDSENIHWLPPLGSMKIRSEGNKPFSLGTVGELVKALKDVQIELDDNDTKNKA